MAFTGKNYRTDGGNRTVIGGTLEFKEGAQVLNFPEGAGFTPAEAQADSTASDVAGLVTDFNALLAKLKTAGLMASE